MSYRPFVMLTATARGLEPWRLVLGLCLAIAVSFVLGQMLLALVVLFLPHGSGGALAAAVHTADTPAGMLLLLLSMGTMGVGAIAAARALHGRGAITLVGPPPVAVHQFTRATLAAGAAALIAAGAMVWAQELPLRAGLDPLRWLALLPLTLPAILLQTGSEELLFRGYLQSQLAARFPYPWLWLTLPSALFALGHYAPGTYGPAAIYVALWAFLFGLAAADLTARSGTLGPAIGLHFANNLVALALVAPGGQMSGLALMRWPFALEDTAMVMRMLPLDLVTLLISWLAARLALRR